MRLIKFLEAIQSIPPILQGLAAEARKTSSFEEFQRDFLGQIKHGTYWHLTDNPQFTIDPKLGPSDQSSIATGSMDVGKLMITSHLEHWEDFYNTDPNTGERVQIRPYAGPRIRDRFQLVVFNAMAVNINRWGMSSGANACRAGMDKARMVPLKNPNQIKSQKSTRSEKMM